MLDSGGNHGRARPQGLKPAKGCGFDAALEGRSSTTLETLANLHAHERENMIGEQAELLDELEQLAKSDWVRKLRINRKER